MSKGVNHAYMPKRDTARGGDVHHCVPNKVKINALPFYDVILLSCKMSYSLKVPYLHSPLLLPEDNLRFWRAISIVVSENHCFAQGILCSCISLLEDRSELEGLPV